MADASASQSWLAARTRWSPWEVAFWLLAFVPFFLFPTYLSLASQIAIAALFALSVDLVLGYAGIVTLGHAMFFGLGAYCAGLISKAGWGEPLTGLIISAAFAGLVGFIASFMIVRVQHLALIMITLGLGLLTYELANSLSWLTGGTDGLRGIDTWPVFGRFKFDLWGYTAYGYALAVLFLAFLFSRRIVNSSFGLALRGVRENVRRMPAIGSDHRRHLQTIYTISAAMAGAAGALLTQTTDTVSLDVLSFQRSADVVVMLILGGTGRLYGAILGALIFMVARDQLAGMNPQYWYFWIGLLLMVVVLLMPRGILGGLARLAEQWNHWLRSTWGSYKGWAHNPLYGHRGEGRMDFLKTLLGGAVGLVWIVAGPLTYVLSVVDTWGGQMSVLGKIAVSLTLDVVLAAIWPVTWVLWIIMHLAGKSTPISMVLGL